MFVGLMQFQQNYFQAVHQGIPEQEDFRAIYFLYHPEKDKSDLQQIEKLYNRFVIVDRSQEFIEPVRQVYASNFITIWNNAIDLRKELNAIQKDRDIEIKKIQALYNECINKTKSYEKFIEERIFLRYSLSATERRKNRIIHQEISHFVRHALLNGSFLWIHDLITLIDIGAFYPDINREQGLFAVRDGLNCEQLIRSSIGDPNRAKIGCKEIEELQRYVQSILNQFSICSGGILYSNTVRCQLTRLLEKCLKNEFDNQELINFILSLRLLSDNEVEDNFLDAFKYHVDEMASQAKQIIETKWLDSQVFVEKMKWLLKEALENKNLEKAKYIIELNQGKSPVNQKKLGEFFESAISPDNVPILKFIYELAGEIPKRNMKAAIKTAKRIACPLVLQYLKPHRSRCAIF